MVDGKSGRREFRAAGARRPVRRLSVAALCIALGACEQSVMVRPAQSDDPPPPRSSSVSDNAPSYTVAPGDTLYKISVQYGLDYRDIANWNAIPAPYTIYPRQRLRMGPPGSDRAEPTPASAAPPAAASGLAATAPVAPQERPAAGAPAAAATPPAPGYDANLGVTLPAGAQSLSDPARPAVAAAAPTFEPVQADAGAAAPRVPEPASTTSTAAANGPAAADLPAADTLANARPASTPVIAPLRDPGGALTATRPTTGADVVSDKPSAAGWIWPTAGKVVGTYASGDPTRQGVDVAGQSGQAVRAARDGEVVYSGAGLIGYGELIIIKHSPELLSAYGHNRVRLVKEGQKVKAGEKIAEMGRNPANRELLHFEIRRNGKPVDPTPLLPAR